MKRQTLLEILNEKPDLSIDLKNHIYGTIFPTNITNAVHEAMELLDDNFAFEGLPAGGCDEAWRGLMKLFVRPRVCAPDQEECESCQ